MSPTKQIVTEVLQSLPEDATIDDVIYRLYVRSQIEAGLKDIEEGRVYSEEEAAAIMDKWLEE
jgi:predicted transcriptional regulator